jgi:hypothetical protein
MSGHLRRCVKNTLEHHGRTILALVVQHGGYPGNTDAADLFDAPLHGVQCERGVGSARRCEHLVLEDDSALPTFIAVVQGAER